MKGIRTVAEEDREREAVVNRIDELIEYLNSMRAICPDRRELRRRIEQDRLPFIWSEGIDGA